MGDVLKRRVLKVKSKEVMKVKSKEGMKEKEREEEEEDAVWERTIEGEKEDDLSLIQCSPCVSCRASLDR